MSAYLKGKSKRRSSLNNWETVKVAIVGGGIAGLSAGWKLRRESFDDLFCSSLKQDRRNVDERNFKRGFLSMGRALLPVPFRKRGIDRASRRNELTEGRIQTVKSHKGTISLPRTGERVFYKAAGMKVCT